MLEQALAALRGGDPARAENLLREITLREPTLAAGHAWHGVACSQLGLHSAALISLHRAIALEPARADHRYNLSVALDRAGDGVGAVHALFDAMELQPNHPEAQARAELLDPIQRSLRAEPRPPSAGPRIAPASVEPIPAAAAPVQATDLGSDIGSTAGWGQSRPAPVFPGTPTVAPPAGQWGREAAPPPMPVAQPAAAPYPGFYSAAYASPGPLGLYGDPAAPNMSTGDAFARRLVARIIDSLLVAVGSLVVPIGIALMSGVVWAAPLLAIVSWFVVAFLYFPLFTGWRGQTPGKMLMGIRVVGPDGLPCGMSKAFLREISARILGNATCGPIDELWMLWDSRQQALHDKVAGTTVVRADP